LSKRSITFGIVLTLTLISVLSLTFNVQSVRANEETIWETIFIRADGSVDPPEAPIARNYDLYVLTGNISSYTDGIVIERNNMTLDGAGYTLQGTEAVYSKGLYLTSRSNVTIQNINVKGFHFGFYLISSSYNAILGNIIASNSYGVWLDSSSDSNTISENSIIATVQTGISVYDSSSCSITGNNITNNWGGIGLFESSECSIVGNNITTNDWGISFGLASGNSIYHNNFVDNTYQVYPGVSTNVWDDGYPSGGNYWSDYLEPTDLFRGPYQNITGSDGIADYPYIIAETDEDRYPLMGPFGPQTISGLNVTVFPTPDIGLTFEEVTVAGSTTAQITAAPTPPSGFVLVGSYYDIKITAVYSGKITIRMIYDDTNLTPEQESSLRLLRYDALATDINSDSKVDWRDICKVMVALGSRPGSPRWDPACDINHDGIINLKDLLAVWKDLGKSAWTDITTFVDTENNLIYGETSHLSGIGIHR